MLNIVDTKKSNHSNNATTKVKWNRGKQVICKEKTCANYWNNPSKKMAVNYQNNDTGSWTRGETSK